MRSTIVLLRSIATAASLCIGAPFVAAQLYTPLGPGEVTDVSADGLTVLGKSTGSFLWTKAGGMVSVPGGEGRRLSADGSTIVGTLIDSGTGTKAAGLWTSSSGWTNLGKLPSQSPPNDLSSGWDVSDDGSIAVGLGWITTPGEAVGFRWDATAGMTELSQFGMGSSRASAIAGDGSLIGGFDESPTARRGALWMPDGSEVLLLVTPSNPMGDGEVSWINSDGSVVVGQSQDEPFRWTPSGGVELLGKPPGANPSHNYWALSASDDGSTIVGGGGSAFFGGFVAWVWTEADGMRRLDDILTANGVTGLASNDLENVLGCSADGKVIAGWGHYPAFESWVVDLGEIGEWHDLGLGLAGTSGVPVLEGLGTQTGGALTRLRLTNARPNGTTALVIGAGRIDAAFKGGVLVPTPDIVLAGLPLNAAGSLLISFPWPAGLPSGSELFYQHWVTDPLGPVGFAASNGLQSISP